jgi:sec-independent protein translocase protein TatA
MGLLSPTHMIVLFAIALIMFGPKKLPEIGKGLGQALREFNKARNDFMDTLHAEAEKSDYSPSSTPDSTISVTQAYTDTHTPAEKVLEYPKPLDAPHADALPYGSDFHAVEGDSQPSFRTAQSEPAATEAASTSSHSGEGKA